ncbi:MAG: hypothetical protein WD669_08915 [Pirellulales bacterium]
MAEVNLWFGWFWITIGLISGAVVGLFFHDPDWLGGYIAWPRRMVRLGHIAFLGTGLLNLGFAGTIAMLGDLAPRPMTDWLFLIGAVTMPTVCFLSAWRESFRYLFVIPVGSLIGGAASLILWRWL